MIKPHAIFLRPGSNREGIGRVKNSEHSKIAEYGTKVNAAVPGEIEAETISRAERKDGRRQYTGQLLVCPTGSAQPIGGLLYQPKSHLGYAALLRRERY